jgi:hypothetical protein
MARRVQDAAAGNAHIMVLRVEHRVDARGRRGSGSARTRHGQDAAVSSPPARRIAGRMNANNDDHQRHQWAHHDSPVTAHNRLDHERPSSRELQHCSRLRFVDRLVNGKVLGEHSLRKANNLVAGCWLLVVILSEAKDLLF